MLDDQEKGEAMIMAASRRLVMAAGATLLASSLMTRRCVAHSPSSQPASVRMRLEAFSTVPARVEALRRGVATMKARKPSDPGSWFYQAAIHGVTAEAVAEAARRDPAVAAVDTARF